MQVAIYVDVDSKMNTTLMDEQHFITHSFQVLPYSINIVLSVSNLNEAFLIS